MCCAAWLPECTSACKRRRCLLDLNVKACHNPVGQAAGGSRAREDPAALRCLLGGLRVRRMARRQRANAEGEAGGRALGAPRDGSMQQTACLMPVGSLLSSHSSPSSPRRHAASLMAISSTSKEQGALTRRGGGAAIRQPSAVAPSCLWAWSQVCSPHSPTIQPLSLADVMNHPTCAPLAPSATCPAARLPLLKAPRHAQPNTTHTHTPGRRSDPAPRTPNQM